MNCLPGKKMVFLHLRTIKNTVLKFFSPQNLEKRIKIQDYVLWLEAMQTGLAVNSEVLAVSHYMKYLSCCGSVECDFSSQEAESGGSLV